MTDEQRKHHAELRWMAASHAMQSGVAMEMNHRPELTQPKHLRVGVNTALADHGSLVRLLIAKGIITELEYLEAIAEGMEREKANYETALSNIISGGKIKITLA